MIEVLSATEKAQSIPNIEQAKKNRPTKYSINTLKQEFLHINDNKTDTTPS